jgi:hypothetical protein
MTTEPATSLVAVLLLERPALPDLTAAAAIQAAIAADAPVPSEQDRNADSVVFRQGDYFGAVALVDQPVPWSELDGPAHTAWYWPQAADRLRSHQAHLVVTLTSDDADAVALARALTLCAAAFAEQTGALGIFWASGTLVHDPPAFRALAEQMKPDWLPLYLWLDFRVNQEQEMTFSLFTTGMAALGFMEIEIPALVCDDPKLLIDQAYHVAHYLLDRGPVLNDGDTIGMSPTVRLTVHHEPSFLGATQLVYSLRP